MDNGDHEIEPLIIKFDLVLELDLQLKSTAKILKNRLDLRKSHDLGLLKVYPSP